MRWTVGLVLPLFLHLATPPAHAGRCQAALDAWIPIGGTLTPDRDCSAVILTADGDGRTTASAQFARILDGDGTFELRWQRLTPDRGHLELKFPGGYVLVNDGAAGIYVNEARWAERGYTPLPAGLASRRQTTESLLRVTLRGEVVSVSLDGVPVLREVVTGRPRAGSFVATIHGPRSSRSRMRLTGAHLTR